VRHKGKLGASASPLNAAEDNALSAAIGLPGEVTSGETNSHSAHGDWRRGPNEESTSIFLIMISPAFADDRNVYDFYPLNLKFE
jgi:hypothetical protein